MLKPWPLFLAALSTLACGNQETAKQAAREYAKDLGYHSVEGVACTGTDTDGDGYISCTARVTDAGGNESTLALECTRGTLTFTSGCKVQMPKMRTNVNVSSK